MAELAVTQWVQTELADRPDSWAVERLSRTTTCTTRSSLGRGRLALGFPISESMISGQGVQVEGVDPAAAP